MDTVKKFKFESLHKVPDVPGIYAWYYIADASKADLENLLINLSGKSFQERCELIRIFLDSKIFSYLKETPYEINIQGALKPQYSGKVPHIPRISNSLIERIAKKPERLCSLNDILRLAVPHFASPIYIGMARISLRSRLLTHQKLICQYREAETISIDSLISRLEMEEKSSEENYDHSLAYEIAHIRQFHPMRLRVHVLPIAAFDGDIAVDAENILNRINFPLCGRM